MRNALPLAGETVIFTGTPKSAEAAELVKSYGGIPVSIPLIEVGEIQKKADQQKLQQAMKADWLIFTSQSAVAAFRAKMLRFNVTADTFNGKVAAVGTRTAAALDKLGFAVSFIPSVFSADVFVKQFNPKKSERLHVVFLKGTLAGSLIREELPFHVSEWTVYETKSATSEIDKLSRFILHKNQVSVLFASPSAVEVFSSRIAPKTTWFGFTVCAIGHVTERALLKVGAPVHVKPETYTLVELVHELAKRKGEFK
ncbi:MULTISPECIES: uroporphyrinogen-III synthase [unclassified Sporosarcina]|uniref:uroporphyrinogen-III synthase n=1 Tax=unclassified Sporosarcina TaxID=2647733 RepID=UPI000C1682B3|nr:MULTISPECIES: uroporphyrinogen-III synthase [unclassified Sporosarcina]PIC98764.1 uroporphyrinogen-III synthase [Sporosarcina sp. P29]PID07311.1 uroporphyrinogen-III synthase [Sporosarcina sp. P30]PID10507.1 uroporphyrinogen-III synthase [Sporosarcina sp. P31]PID13092.1 uroporphyrinogen-III synthase [Sporosarcina sp. P32b]